MGSFFLWQPTLDPDQKGCRFDVHSDDFGQIHQGTPALMAEFLQVSQIEGEISHWHISPFCTPYYAMAYAPHWRDTYIRSWRIEIKFKGEGQQIAPLSFQPYSVKGSDSSWVESEESLEEALNWQEKRCVVIADFADMTEAQLNAFVEEALAFAAIIGKEVVQLMPRLLQLRLDMGKQRFPQAIDQIEPVVAICQQKAISTHWGKTLLETEKWQEDLKEAFLRQKYASDLRKLMGK